MRSIHFNLMTDITKCPLSLILTSCIRLRSWVKGSEQKKNGKKRRVKTFQRLLFKMKYVALAPYVRLCAIAGLGPWVLMKLGRESLAGNFNSIAKPRKIKRNKPKWPRQSTRACFFYSTNCKEGRQGKNIKSSNGYMKFFKLGYYFFVIVTCL